MALYLLIRTEWLDPITLRNPSDFTSYGVTIVRLIRHTIGDLSFPAAEDNEYNTTMVTTMLISWTVSAGSLFAPRPRCIPPFFF